MRFTDAKVALSRQLRGRINNSGRVRQLAQPASPPPPPPPGSDGDPEQTVRIEAQADQDCTFRPAPGVVPVPGGLLRMKLQVYKLHEPRYHSYVGYYCSVSLRRPGVLNFEDIGTVHASRLSKPSIHAPRMCPSSWRDDWLLGQADEIVYPNGTMSFAKALRAIYNPNGSVRGRVAAAFRNEFANNGTGNDLVYISQLYVKMQNEDGSVNVSASTGCYLCLARAHCVFEGFVKLTDV